MTDTAHLAVRLNGQERELPATASVADVVRLLGARDTGTAVAVDGEVVPRSAWASTHLRAGAAVEVLTAVQGG